ncbi:MAG TPA: 4-(cytidine 5'-diphospho)-2-C-methyl-D-erythritol kinase [Anaerolineae bacterium]|nr:4-(cytidine 5'-diphospho)-2-C-methyl-D-erythritol kinase [Anaerolineae bacterium]
MKSELVWPAPAKLNLFLHILGRRPDGYHLLQTVFQFLDTGDTLRFRMRGDGVVQRGNAIAGLAPEDDLVVRAARLLRDAAGVSQGVDIELNKTLPMGAGLGGGSSDAATVLVALNHLWRLGFSRDQLAHLGLQLGADVPVFVRGRAAWAEGVGEDLTPIELAEPWYLVVVPPCHVSTAAVFGAAELTRDRPPIKIPAFLSGEGQNVCEPVVRRRYPAVGQALDWLGRFGTARMSGTGAAVFAPFADRAAAVAVSRRVPASWRALVARGCNRSPLLHMTESLKDHPPRGC